MENLKKTIYFIIALIAGIMDKTFIRHSPINSRLIKSFDI
jgi:hypothetical protein